MSQFPADWYFIGREMQMHYVSAMGRGRVSQCGIHANAKRVHSGHSTRKCELCLKSMQENGKIKR